MFHPKNGQKYKDEGHLFLFNDIVLLVTKQSKLFSRTRNFEIWELDSIILNDTPEEGWPDLLFSPSTPLLRALNANVG